MRIKVFLEKENLRKEVDVSRSETIESLLKRLGISPQAVIVMRNGDAVPENETLREKDSLRIIRFK